MSRRLALALVLVAGLVLVSSASSQTDRGGAVRVKGKAVFPVTDGAANCSFAPQGAKVRERCVPGFGTFTGTPGRAGASVGWTWIADVENGLMTGFGTEKLTLKLNFGGNKTLVLACSGKLKPAGTQTPDGGTIVGAGTCVVKKSTGFARTLSGRANNKYTSKYKRTGSKYPKPTVKVDIND